MNTSIRVLHGCNSPESAHLSMAYPFGRTRCVRREWVEHSARGGTKGKCRFVTQTTEKAFNQEYTDRIHCDGQESADAWAREQIAAGKVRWNAIKPSTYSSFMVLIEKPLNDGSDRLGVDYLSYQVLSGPTQLVALKKATQGQLDADQSALLAAFEILDRKLNVTSWQRYEAELVPARVIQEGIEGAHALQEPVCEAVA